MSNKGNPNRTTFAEMLKQTGASGHIPRLPDKVTPEQIIRLEAAITAISPQGQYHVDHEPVYNPVRDVLSSYKTNEGLQQGSGLTKLLLDTLFLGIDNGLNFILHVNGRDSTRLRGHIENRAYLPTMEARIEYVDALINLAYSASLQRKALVNDVSGKAVYDQSDLIQWKSLKEKFMAAVKYLRIMDAGTSEKSYDAPYLIAIRDAYAAAKSFARTTRELADSGVALLFNSTKPTGG